MKSAPPDLPVTFTNTAACDLPSNQGGGRELTEGAAPAHPQRKTKSPRTDRPPRPARARMKERSVPPMAPLRRLLRRSAIRMLDRGWFGSVPLQGHLVICGFPRAGTTLLQLMVQTAVPSARSFVRERSGLGVAQNHWPRSGQQPYLVTKRPDDIFWIDEIRDFYARLGTRTRVRFVICVRDPRAVLTSRHELNKSEYWVSVERWRAIYEQLRWAEGSTDVCVVDFSDIVARVSMVQQQLTGLMGWAVSSDFNDFHKHVPEDFDTKALNGIRSLDTGTLRRWSQPDHADRMRSLLREMPELPERVMEMGYESDDAWTASYR